MRTEEAVTGAEGIPVGYGALALVYLALAAMVLFLLRRLARRPPEIEAQRGSGPADSARSPLAALGEGAEQ